MSDSGNWRFTYLRYFYIAKKVNYGVLTYLLGKLGISLDFNESET